MKEWENEKDSYNKKYKGYILFVYRHSNLGHLCGYVQIKTSGNNYDKLPYHVHGGLTYCEPYNEIWKEAKKVFDPNGGDIIGFDCAHLGDIVPFQLHIIKEGTYKNYIFVLNELENLVDQIFNDKK